MFARPLLAFCSVSLVMLHTLVAQTTTPAQPVEKTNPTSAPAIANSPTQPQISFDSVHVDGPYIALTFDDGPSATLTPKLLDLLAAHQMKATFFVVGQNAADNPAILKRALREGHAIATPSPVAISGLVVYR